MTPYYQDNHVTIYCGDCREILPQLEAIESIVTDPVWPNTDVQFAITDNPYQLFSEMCQAIPRDTERLVVQLGCDSDPRFLAGIPSSWPFLRVCWLDYARPSYKGRLLYTGDVAYAFGRPPAYITGRQVMSGMCRSSKLDKGFQRHSYKTKPNGKRWFTYTEDNRLPHPTPRRLQHVEWLVHQFSDHVVCDPFMGSGTTAVAAKKLNRKFVGIEISEEYCALAADRCRQLAMELV